MLRHLRSIQFRNLLAVRFLSDTPTEGERKITDILRQKFPGAKNVQVSDISGGCGAMYEVLVEAEEFRGKRTVLQHKMINELVLNENAVDLMALLHLNRKSYQHGVINRRLLYMISGLSSPSMAQKGLVLRMQNPEKVLKEEIKEMHGLRINTKVPS